MTGRATDTGVVRSIEKLQDGEGRMVLRAVVDFMDGDGPDLSFRTVWDRIPVRIVEVRAHGETLKGEENGKV